MDFLKRQRIDIPKIRKAAKGEDCTLESPYCNHDSSTVVLCHLNQMYAGKGKSLKPDDTAAFFGCSGCHDGYDGRLGPNALSLVGYDAIWLVLRACVRTWRRLIEKGVLK